MSRLWRLFQSQIRYKIILPYLSLMLLVTLAGAAIALALTAASWQERLNEQLKQMARSTSTALLQRERDHLAFLYPIALAQANPAVGALSMGDAFASNDRAEVIKAIQPFYDLQRQFPDSLDVDRFIAFDSSGKAYFDWLRTDDAGPPADAGRTNLGDVESVQLVLASSPDQEIDKYANLIQFLPDPQPYFYTIVPVSRGDDVVGGVLIAVKIDRLLKSFERTSQSVITNYYSLDGRMLGSSLLRRDDEQPTFVMDEQTLRQLETSRTGAVFDTVQIRGNNYELTYSPLVVAQAQIGYFSVGISRDFQAESLSLSRNAVLAITMLLAIGAVILGYRIAQSITQPLGSLVETAEAVSAGDLLRRTNITSDDELGRLGVAFNQMTEDLLRLYTTSRDLSSEIDVDSVLRVAEETAGSLVRGVEVFALLDNRGSWTYVLPQNASPNVRRLAVVRLSADDALLHELARDRQQRLVSAGEQMLETSGLVGIAGFRQLLLTPLLIQESLVGILIFGHTDPDAFQPSELPALASAANMATSVLYNAVIFDQVHEEASERQAILQSIADGVVVVDDLRMITLANDAAQKMLGLPMPQLVRQSFDELPLERLPAGQGLFSESRLEVEHYRINSRVITMSRAPVVDQDKPIGEVIVLHDISAEVAIDEAKTQFIATISHELRTPLTPIYSYVELLQRGVYGEMNSDQREVLEVIHNRAEQLRGLIQNIVLVASIQSNTLTTEIETLDLGGVIETTVAPLQRQIDKKGIALQVSLPADLPPVASDREQLRLILNQLLDNARRYTNQGSISIRAARHGDVVQVDVADTGPGIPAEQLGQLFTRFHRIDGNSSQERGGGLGLAITRQLVERLGGQVWATSEVGTGSTFSFSLPVADGQIDAVVGPDTTNTTA